jgi:dihydropyrimidinase
MYLHLTDELFEQADAAKYVGAPPLRTHRDRVALWTALATGDVQSVCTDHAPWTLEQKLDPSLDVRSLRQGVSDLETLMPMLWSEGVVQGRISVGRFVELTSTNAAKLFGMYPRKGTVAVGSEADLVVWNGDARRPVRAASMLSRAGYSVYEGREVQGWPDLVVSRGGVVYESGSVRARKGRGRLVKRGPTQPL